MTKHPRSVVERPAHIALLASPARQELVDTLDALGIGNGTVKTHLRNLFQKTGVKHQADLVRLVAGFANGSVLR